MDTKILKQPREALMKLGYAGLLFFFLKGLAWLFLPAVIAWFL